MGDLESGFEEMEGVKLGYLVIKGKQMFALSQVFTDLLKNIPRTTVHKRMDHLNVKKHHCDLEELRKLKAINSIAFHAAKCTLISREDVEALYVSCKTERVLRSKRRKLKASAPADLCHGHLRAEPHGGFWKEKVWLSLHGVPQPFSLRDGAGRLHGSAAPAAAAAAAAAANLPQICSKFASHGFPAGAKAACKMPKNFESAHVPGGGRLTFSPGHSLFRSVVCGRQPVLYQSAIALQSKLPSSADLAYKRKRQQDGGTGWHLCSNKSRHGRRVLLVPKCCKSKASAGALGTFHLDRGLYLSQNQHQHQHQHHYQQQQQQQQQQHAGTFQESCSSESESSSYSERADNDDSDFGSSLSTSSNSGTSDDDDDEEEEEEEDEEDDDSLSESSDVTSEDDSSSESDSSSASSQVSLQSIRFRRTSFSALGAKAPLVTQPVFLYEAHKARSAGGSALVDCGLPGRKVAKAERKPWAKKQEAGGAPRQRANGPPASCCPASSRSRETLPGAAASHPEVCEEPAIKGAAEGAHSPGSKENKEFAQQRLSAEANKCPQALTSHCAQDKETMVAQSSESNPSLAVNFKKELKISPCPRAPQHPGGIKAEPEDPGASPGVPEESAAARASPALPENVKIKVEDNSDEYEYAYEYRYSRQLAAGPEDKPLDSSAHVKCARCADGSAAAGAREFRSTLNRPYAEEGEYKNGARVRKNYRTLVLGTHSGAARTPLKVTARAERSPRATGKAEPRDASAEECAGAGAGAGAGASKRKRAAGCVAAAVKKPFSFMANFPCPPSLIIGSDGDLCPAYSLKCVKDNKSPHRSHPVWKWQLGGSAVPLPPSHRFRKF